MLYEKKGNLTGNQLRRLGIKVVTGHRYLGGYIGDREAESRWLADNITGWVESVDILDRVSRNLLQYTYA